MSEIDKRASSKWSTCIPPTFLPPEGLSNSDSNFKLFVWTLDKMRLLQLGQMKMTIFHHAELLLWPVKMLTTWSSRRRSCFQCWPLDHGVEEQDVDPLGLAVAHATCDPLRLGLGLPRLRVQVELRQKTGQLHKRRWVVVVVVVVLIE